jgi:hypothetical protein
MAKKASFESDQTQALPLRDSRTLHEDYEKEAARITRFIAILEFLADPPPNLIPSLTGHSKKKLSLTISVPTVLLS